MPAREGEAGIILVDKPGGITSHGVVSRVRRALGTRKVGHAGTLDPAATGLLVLGINRGTKLLHFLTGLDKSYRATIRLGASTVTDDAEGDLITDLGAQLALTSRLEEAMESQRGRIMQVPSAVSAIKIDGQRAHKLVRSGAQVQIPARPVTVRRFELLQKPVQAGRYVDMDVEIECSSGTYVRSIARDLGQVLGVGGHVTALRRTQVGPWSVREAHRLDSLPEPGSIIPAGEACKELYPEAQITQQECRGVSYGNKPEARVGDAADGTVFCLVCPDGKVAGLGELKADRLRPVFVVDPV